jgi:hypothetical protein
MTPNLPVSGPLVIKTARPTSTNVLKAISIGRSLFLVWVVVEQDRLTDWMDIVIPTRDIPRLGSSSHAQELP